MPPLADAVGLVDRQQRGTNLRHRLHEPRGPKSLGGDIDQVVLPRLDLQESSPLFGRVERAVQQGGSNPAREPGHPPGPSSSHQRADDQRHPGEQEGGQLVAEALAAAGRHHAKDVATLDDVRDHVALGQAETPPGRTVLGGFVRGRPRLSATLMNVDPSG